jgi:hypothetical protein
LRRREAMKELQRLSFEKRQLCWSGLPSDPGITSEGSPSAHAVSRRVIDSAGWAQPHLWKMATRYAGVDTGCCVGLLSNPSASAFCVMVHSARRIFREIWRMDSGCGQRRRSASSSGGDQGAVIGARAIALISAVSDLGFQPFSVSGVTEGARSPKPARKGPRCCPTRARPSLCSQVIR